MDPVLVPCRWRWRLTQPPRPYLQRRGLGGRVERRDLHTCMPHENRPSHPSKGISRMCNHGAKWTPQRATWGETKAECLLSLKGRIKRKGMRRGDQTRPKTTPKQESCHNGRTQTSVGHEVASHALTQSPSAPRYRCRPGLGAADGGLIAS